MTPGETAVAAIGDDLNGYVLIVLDESGEAATILGVSRRFARQAIDLAVERLQDETLHGSQPSRLRRMKGGTWACRMKCPDGLIRLFVEKRPKKEQIRRPLSPALRWDVLSRDAFACRYCGRRAPDVELVIDHVIPVVEGGTDAPSNLAAACSECNAGKGRKTLLLSDRLTVSVTASSEAS